MDAKQKLVVVGNGMAGIRTLEELLKLTPDLYEITVFGAEPHPNYNRILLSPVLTGEQSLQDIVLNDEDWYVRHGIRLLLNRKVVGVNRARRTVLADDGSETPYDRLLLATGSNPFILPVPGSDLDGVVAFRDIGDVNRMIEASSRYRHAVVIGGGLLGLEAANGLAARGMKFLLGRQTREILGGADGRVRALRFADGAEIPADLVVMAVGVRPNTELAERCGLHVNRGVVVSDTLQTYDPRIYAVGECVSHRGTAYGLVAPLYEQAKVAANHLALHGIGRYEGSVTSTRLKVTGIDLFSAGDFAGGQQTESITLADTPGGVYKKLVIRDDKLVGACLYGDTADSAWYVRLIREGRRIGALRERLMHGEGAAEE
jgi:nitrite reductase (NADH) large subunit